MLLALLSLVLAVTPLPNAATSEVVIPPHVGPDRVDYYTRVAVAGQQWFVAWTSTSGSRATFIDANGHPLLPTPVDLIGGADAVSCSDRSCLVVWSDNMGEAVGMRIDDTGQTVGAAPFLIHEHGQDWDWALPDRVTWDGHEFVVPVFLDKVMGAAFHVDQHVTLVDADGRITSDLDLGQFIVEAQASLDGVTLFSDSQGNVRTLTSAATVSTLTNPTSVALAAGAAGFLIIGKTSHGIVGRFLDFQGRPSGAEFPIAGATDSPSVAWDGSSYVVSWLAAGALHGTRLQQAIPQTGPAFTIAADREIVEPILANGNGSILALWSNPRLQSSIVTENGASAHADVDPPTALDIARFTPAAPLLAGSSGGAAVAWSESGSHDDVLRFAHAGSDGLSVPTDVAAGGVKTIATNGSQSLIVEPAEFVVRAVLVDAAGHTLSTTDIPKLLNTGNIAATPFDDGFLIAWVGLPDYSTTLALYFVRLGLDGVAGDVKTIASGSFLNVVAMTASHDRALVVVRNADSGAGGFLVSPDLTASATDPIAAANELPTSVSATTDGMNFLVSWISHGLVVANDYVAARRIDANGRVIDPSHFIYSGGDDRKFNAVPFWTGANYEIVWSEGGRPWGLRIAADGTLIDYPPLLLANVPIPDSTAFAQIAGSRVLAAWADTDGVHLRTLDVLRRRPR